jgi:acetyl esterase
MQLLVYPVTDHNFSTESYGVNGDGYLLTKDMMEWFWSHYLSKKSDGKNHLASPLRAKNLAGLPPALVITAEFDPLRDEGEAYAERLRDAGVPVEVQRFDGQIHGFFGLGSIFPAANDAVDLAVANVKAALHEGGAARRPGGPAPGGSIER